VQDKFLEGTSNSENLKVYRIYSNYHPRWQAWLSLYNPQTVLKVKRIIKEIKPDIIHVHNIHKYLSYHCLKIAKKYTKGIFLTAHDVMLVHYGKFLPKEGKDVCKIRAWSHIKEAQKRYNPFRNIFIRRYLKYVDKIFTVSNSLKKLLRINDIKNVETIYNGIDINDWKIDPDKVRKFKEKYNLQNKKVIFFGGRLSGAKGGDQILKAISLIKKKIKNIVLLVAGERNKYVADMERLVKELSLEKNIVFTGWLEGNDLKAAYHSADICACPSICFEAFGMTNLEAMACKKPVVSSYFGGPKEVIIDPARGGAGIQTGYLVNPNDVELMTEKIIDLLKNPQRAEKLGEAGYRRAKEKFSLDRQVKETLKWYKKYV
jgi:glycosyltransferase involved in cell wall biosynthesis